LSDQPHESEVALPAPVDVWADGQVEVAAEPSRQDAPAGRPRFNASRRSSGLQSERPASASPGIGKRPLRTSILRFALAALIGVAGTLSWQAYGDRLRDAVRAWAPALDWLIAPGTPKSATANADPGALAEQLKPIALDLAVVRKAIEQLAFNQQQLAAKDAEIAQSIAALQATQQALGDKISASPAPKIAHAPPRRAAQPPPLSLNAQ